MLLGLDARTHRRRRPLPPGWVLRAHAPVLGVGSAPELAMTNDEVLRAAHALAVSRGLTPAGAQAITGKGWAESFLGVRTGKGAREGTTQFLLSTGEPSYNWGAITAREGEQWFPGTDRGADGKPIKQRWARFGSMAEGLDAYLSRGSVAASLDALNAGDAVRAAAVLYDRGYYTGTEGTREDRIRAYAAMLVGAAQRVATATGKPLLVHAKGAVPPKGAGAGATPATPPKPKPKAPASSSSSAPAWLLAAGAFVAAVAMGVR